MSDDGEKRAPGVEPDLRSRVDPRLLDILVCPVTRAELTYAPVRQELVSRAARLAYPIRDGVPIMLPEEARKLDD
jgi:uncharacterized protein YbaR (Trm112 family)